MKLMLGVIVLFVFAAMFGLALVAARGRGERYERIDDERLR